MKWSAGHLVACRFRSGWWWCHPCQQAPPGTSDGPATCQAATTYSTIELGSAAAAASNCCTIGCSRLRFPASRVVAVYEAPASQARVIDGSSGTRPRNGTPYALAIASAPPFERGKTSAPARSCNTSGHDSRSFCSVSEVTSAPTALRNRKLSSGATYSAMFSSTPSTRSLVFLQKESSFRTSIRLTSCGVETIRAPSCGLSALARYCTSEICSSDVPGGVSTMR
mmetsp:Transcript_30367/g.68555  ORF Transcript_30367/g.68555 Transcript_30367/m.68555 type:complete len:225 (-) Transcript_30367:737-1411(-)